MKTERLSYEDLQQHIDHLVGKLGLQTTISLLAGLSGASQDILPALGWIKLLTVFLIAKSTEVFSLKQEEFFSSKAHQYREARMSCYYLLKRHSNRSYQKIGDDFKTTKRSVFYNYHKCQEFLSLPDSYRGFNLRFKLLEEKTIHFISKINK